MQNSHTGGTLGSFTLSFDFELGWGCTEKRLWVEREKSGVYDEMRVVLPKFFEALDSMELPATFAVVGAMIHEPGKRDFGHLPNAARNIVEDFCSRSKDTTNDGRDLMDLLLNTKVQHNIACHSYSHVRFDFDGFTEPVAEREIEMFKDAEKAFGFNARSLVCPQNIVRFESIYSGAGYTGVRTPPMRGDRPDGRWARLTRLPPYSTRREVAGIWRESGSVLYNPGVKRRYMLPLLHFRTKRAMQLAMNSAKDVHVWLHPFNLVDTPGVLNSLLELLEFVAQCRDKGKISTRVF